MLTIHGLLLAMRFLIRKRIAKSVRHHRNGRCALLLIERSGKLRIVWFTT